MKDSIDLSYTAFEGAKLLLTGTLDKVALKVKGRLKTDKEARILIFSDATGKEMDLDLRGSDADVLDRLRVYLAPKDAEPASGGPGRPKLGVVAREVSLLPRHWEWLASQSGGASAAIRRLVDAARTNPSTRDLQERTHKFMTAIAGDLPGYEEALRALYAKNQKVFRQHIEDWPADIRKHTGRLAEAIWSAK